MSKQNGEYNGEFGVNNQLYFCGVPFRLDSYSGCTHSCRYCLSPETKILMADLSVKEAQSIKTGDKLVGFDEYPVNKQRHLRVATVLGTKQHKTTNMWKIHTPEKDILCTGDHPWLHSTGGSWAKAQCFNSQGTSLRKLIEPIIVKETELYNQGYIVGLFEAEGSMRYQKGQSYYNPKTPYFVIGQAENNIEALFRLKYCLESLEFANLIITEVKPNSQGVGQRFFVLQMQDLKRVEKIYSLIHNTAIKEWAEFKRGWLAGFFDGEGTCSRKSMGGSIFIAQKDGSEHRKTLESYCKEFGFKINLSGDGGYLVGGTREALRFLNLTVPAITRKKDAWAGDTKWGTDVRIESAEPVSGEFDVIDIETDTHTFIADGYGTHNCFARSSDLTNNAVVGKKEIGAIQVPDKTHFMKMMVVALDQGGNRADINIEWLQRRVPIHWGGMSDPFQPAEALYKVSSAWMDRLNWYNYPVAISTKGTKILTSPEYMAKLKAGKYAVQVTCIGQDDNLIKQLEPGAPLASERIDALKRLADAGFWTAVRIQPVMPGTSLERDLPNYIRTLAKAGVKHVLSEGYKVPMRSSDWMKDVWTLFPEAAIEYNAYKADYFGFEKLLPSWRKYKYIKVIKQACHENGMTFGAADNDLRDLGDTICCCGLDNIPGFENFWRYQASQAVMIAKEKGSVSLADMQQYWSGGKNSMDSGNTLNQEMYEEVYGYKKGEAVKNKERKAGGGLLGVQDGEMRRQARATGTRYTAKYCVDWMWNAGGECSPEGIVSMTKVVNKVGEVSYTYSNPIPKLEKGNVTQSTLF